MKYFEDSLFYKNLRVIPKSQRNHYYLTENGNLLLKNNIFIESPDPSSLAHLIVLNRYFEYIELKEKGRIRSGKYQRLKKKFLENILKKDGKIFCHYCGRRLYKAKKGLKVCSDNTVTIDHILPISKYPEKRLDITNFRASCLSCNMNKGSKDINQTLTYTNE